MMKKHLFLQHVGTKISKWNVDKQISNMVLGLKIIDIVTPQEQGINLFISKPCKSSMHATNGLGQMEGQCFMPVDEMPSLLKISHA